MKNNVKYQNRKCLIYKTNSDNFIPSFFGGRCLSYTFLSIGKISFNSKDCLFRILNKDKRRNCISFYERKWITINLNKSSNKLKTRKSNYKHKIFLMWWSNMSNCLSVLFKYLCLFHLLNFKMENIERDKYMHVKRFLLTTNYWNDTLVA